MTVDLNTRSTRVGQGNAPSIDTLMERAAAMRPVLAERARETELNRRVSQETTELLRANGLLAMTKPARFGGYEYGPSALMRLGYELGSACSSSAWCAALANSNAWFASYWTLQAQQDVWGGGDADHLIAAPLAPTGKCEATGEGYRLWGRWPFASNCENSDWAIISAVIPEAGDAPSGPGWFLTPMSTLQIDQDTWHMSGMQGTGSKTLYTDAPIFVPRHRMIRISDVIAGTTPGAQVEDNPLSQFSWSTFGAAALVGPMLGMARGALDWFVVNMRTKVRPGATSGAADNPFVQERAGRAQATLDATLALLLQDLGQAEEKIFAGGRLDEFERVRVRRDFGYAAQQAVEVVGSLYGAAGASAAEVDKPIQRFWRDINAAGGHVSLDAPSIMAMTGRTMFGLVPAGAH